MRERKDECLVSCPCLVLLGFFEDFEEGHPAGRTISITWNVHNNLTDLRTCSFHDGCMARREVCPLKYASRKISWVWKKEQAGNRSSASMDLGCKGWVAKRKKWFPYRESNPGRLGENQKCCQLHHTGSLLSKAATWLVYSIIQHNK